MLIVWKGDRCGGQKPRRVAVNFGVLGHDHLVTHRPDAVGHDGRRGMRLGVEPTDVKVADHDVANGRLGQPEKTACRVREAVDGDILDSDPVNCRRACADCRGGTALHPGVMAIGVAMIMGVGRYGRLHPLHLHAPHRDTGDRAPAPAPGLQPEATVGAAHLTILDGDVVHAP